MPDKSHFICKHCIYYDVGFCKIYPVPTRKSAPSTEFCGQGKWLIWNERFKEMCPYYWGEWERGDPETDRSMAARLGIPTYDEQPNLKEAITKFGKPTPQEIYDAEEYLKKEGN